MSSDDSLLDEVSEDVPYLEDALALIPSDSNDDNLTVESRVIGKNSLGEVVREGPYGNEDSRIKIAYILGQHPRESNAHDAIYQAIVNDSEELNYSYYIYRINVTAESEDFEESRMNGQLLAQKYVVKDVIKKDYYLAIDIHSSNGGYVQDPYLFAPVSDDAIAYEVAQNITDAIKYVIYYEPASYTSPPYSTIPIDEGGIPAIVFEMRGNPDHSLEEEADEFVRIVDNLKF